MSLENKDNWVQPQLFEEIDEAFTFLFPDVTWQTLFNEEKK